mmetsp:Transcript_3930/g.10304  ORF Transcript_3930/g.10304 Transcript_3930/m.10304 type:complete len:143 (-) Transcript_3930:1489-1917(-)
MATETKGLKDYTTNEVSKHTSEDDCWMIIGNEMNGGARVYDVTKYLDDHPGGAEVMLDLSGQNADEFFEDIGHSQDARTELEKYLIGIHKMTEEEIEAMRIQAENKANKGGSSPIVFLLIAIAAIIYAYFQEVSNSSIHSWS